jgi:hypothetical protein
MERDTSNALQALAYLWCNFALAPMEIWRWEFLWLDLHIQSEQLRLYLNEIRNEGGPRCAIALISHPFPMVATRGRTLEGQPLTVQLLTGAAVDLLNADNVRAEPKPSLGPKGESCACFYASKPLFGRALFFLCPEAKGGKVPSDLMDNTTATLQLDTRHAEFRLKFANGTRKQPVYFQFHVNISLRRTGGGGEEQLQVTSKPTPPTISVTNEVGTFDLG